MSEHALTQLETDLSQDVFRIAKRLQRLGGTPLVTLVVRPPKGSGERDVVMTTDSAEEAIAAIRRMTARRNGVKAMEAAEAAARAERPPEPTTIEEARYEGMGVLLGCIDSSNALAPPPGTSATQALMRWSVMVEHAARDTYGEMWDEFVRRARAAS